MKLNKILLAGLVSLSMVSVANANGVINFSGQVVDTPCSSGGSNGGNPVVDFGTIALNALTPGSSAPAQAFEIKLLGCSTATLKNAVITFNGTAGPDDTFGVSGAAKNIGILIKGQDVIAPGGSETRALVVGDNTFRYTAAVTADASTLPANKATVGNFTGVANYTVAYK